MEAWKVLLIVAALPVVGAGALAYMNGEAYKQQIVERKATADKVDRIKGDLASTRQSIEDTENTIASMEAETEKLTADLNDANAKISEQELKIQTATTEIAAAQTEIDKLKEVENMIDDIEKLDDQLAEAKQKVESVQAELNNVQNLLAVKNAKKNELQDEIDRRQTEEKNRKAGIMTEDLVTTVKAAYNDWGFVVINAGDNDKLVNRATLDVTRQGKPICKLLVTEVEPNQAVADIIPGSMMPGQLVQVGDTVSKVGAASANSNN